MNKQLFIKVQDKETSDKLLAEGFVLASFDGTTWTFMNNCLFIYINSLYPLSSLEREPSSVSSVASFVGAPPWIGSAAFEFPDWV